MTSFSVSISSATSSQLTNMMFAAIPWQLSLSYSSSLCENLESPRKMSALEPVFARLTMAISKLGESLVEEYSSSGTVETARRVLLSDGIGVVTVGIARDRVILAIITVLSAHSTPFDVPPTPVITTLSELVLFLFYEPVCACRTYLEDSTGVATHKGLLSPKQKQKRNTTPTIDVVTTKVIAPGGLHSTSLPPPLGAEVSSTHPRNDAVAGRTASNDSGKVAVMTARRPG
ncbi:hypothetical protein EDB86DRAFT_3243107 [Lactarius hatsudake]|nr:hypothetical protein EDB86DRAFT_3243107 [Lactarius hatsudake]